MIKKIGFWSVLAIVISSQIGSGILILPVTLTPFGFYSLLGWLTSALGAISLALVFAGLCQRFPKTGGPHAFVNAVFGKTVAFFTGWTYWVISWFSTTVVVIASVGYLSPFIRHDTPQVYCALEVLILVSITWLNLRGVRLAGRAGFILMLLKTLPLLILPIAAFWFFNHENFVMAPEVINQPPSSILAQVTLLTLWGFIGLETATTSAGSVINPSKTIPKAIILGTACAAILYMINSIGIMGLMPANILGQSKAPYIEAANRVFSGEWHLVIAAIASIICIGTLNAWMLASGQIAVGLAEDKLLPAVFSKRNKKDAPVIGLIVSGIGILPFLFLMMNHSMAEQIATVIDYSVTAFLYVYLCCTLAYIKILWQEKATLFHWIYSMIALIFCIWILYETEALILIVAAMFVLSGLPLYIFWLNRKKKNI